MPEGGLSIRWPDDWIEQEHRLHQYKLNAVRAFARQNKIDKTIINSQNPKLGVVTTGKSYLDVRQALEDLGINEAKADKIGLRLYKVGMPWPLEPQGIDEFSQGLKEILVIEEKRPIIESQLKEHLYNHAPENRPKRSREVR